MTFGRHWASWFGVMFLLNVIPRPWEYSGARAAEPDSGSVSAPVPSNLTGEQLAQQICSSCHLQPDPRILDKKAWREQILPRMETFLGVSPPDYSKSPEGELLRELHIYPDGTTLAKADWRKIEDHYLAAAPETAVPQGSRDPITVGLKQFTFSPVRFRFTPPATTLVKASSEGGRMFLGDGAAGSVGVLGLDGRLQETLRVEKTAVSLFETASGIFVTAIGSFLPSEYQRGELLFFERNGGHFGAPKVILKGLPRAAHAEFADFNRDGKLDVAMCLFGNHRGRLSWFENLGGDEYREQVLYEKSGPVHCVAHDFNGDGIVDIGFLVAQATESFFILTNDGRGEFKSELVFQRHSAFGHNYFELADFDGDGRKDLLVANGDNGEFESPLKNYHGVRIYLCRGGTRFEEAYFFPQNGTTKAMARDFDGDGDLDIASIAFYPDYEQSPRESFVYLENQGNLRFIPSTFSQCVAGRWLVMDAADIDGDGDVDLLLGSYIRGPTKVPALLSQMWERQGPSLIVLRNNLK